MAHFAELDDNNVVTRVVVVGNDVTTAAGTGMTIIEPLRVEEAVAAALTAVRE